MKPSLLSRCRRAFTLMEMLVVVAILLILMAIAIPAYNSVRDRSRESEAINALRQLAGAMVNYAGQNDGVLPPEDAKGTDSWQAAAQPENSQVWYNSLPHLLGQQGVGDYAKNPRAFYSKANLLFSTGATYPPSDAKLKKPLFAYAINTKLQRKLGAPVKSPVRISLITSASRTVSFLEQGLPGEKKAMDQQPKYDGACKGSAKSFVARYGGHGALGFMDGHAEIVAGTDILTITGKFPYPQDKVVWTRTPEEDPNK